jgi:hypothetical protein
VVAYAGVSVVLPAVPKGGIRRTVSSSAMPLWDPFAGRLFLQELPQLEHHSQVALALHRLWIRNDHPWRRLPSLDATLDVAQPKHIDAPCFPGLKVTRFPFRHPH